MAKKCSQTRPALARANAPKLLDLEAPLTAVTPKLPETPFSGIMREHSYASSTPITDGEKLYVFFGKSGVFAFDLDGKQLWSADVGSATHMWGSAASPALCKDVLIVNASIESKSIVALDKNTGKEIWRKSNIGNSWSSPVVVETKDGGCEVVMSLPGKVVAYELKTGKELWHCEGIGGGKGGGGFGGGGFGGGKGGSYTASTPVVKDGVVYVIGGGGPSAAAVSFAVKAGGKGDVNATHVLWKQKAGASSPSPVISGEQLLFVDGTVTSMSLADGKITYKERLHDARGEYVSAVAAGDKVYALTRYNGMFVIAGGAKFEKLGHYDFPGDTSIFNASPAITDGRLFVRSNAYLYCIGKK